MPTNGAIGNYTRPPIKPNLALSGAPVAIRPTSSRPEIPSLKNKFSGEDFPAKCYQHFSLYLPQDRGLESLMNITKLIIKIHS